MCYDTVHYMQYISIFNHPVTMHKRICIVLFYGIQEYSCSLLSSIFNFMYFVFFCFSIYPTKNRPVQQTPAAQAKEHPTPYTYHIMYLNILQYLATKILLFHGAAIAFLPAFDNKRRTPARCLPDRGSPML